MDLNREREPNTGWRGGAPMSAFPQPEKYWNTEEGATHNESETQTTCEYNLPQLQDNDFQRDAARIEHASATSPRAPRKPRVSGNANAGHSRAERSSYRAPLPPGGSKKNTVKRPEPSPDTTSAEMPMTNHKKTGSWPACWPFCWARLEPRIFT